MNFRKRVVAVAAIVAVGLSSAVVAGGSDGSLVSEGGCVSGRCGNGPTVVVAPKGMYSQYLNLARRARAVCQYQATHTGALALEASYNQMLNDYDNIRGPLNISMQKRGYGLAPSLKDFEDIGSFKIKRHKRMVMGCPRG